MNAAASNRNMISFVNKDYDDPVSFYSERYKIIRGMSLANDRFTATVFTDRKGFVSGGPFQNLSKFADSEFVRQYLSDSHRYMLYIGYDKKSNVEQRFFSLVSLYDMSGKGNKKENRPIIKIDMNYSNIQQIIDNANYSNTVYVCIDDYVVFSNDQKGGLLSPFMRRENIPFDKVSFSDSFKLLDKTADIYVVGKENIFVRALKENLGLFIMLLALNILIPFVVFSFFIKSFVGRLKILTDFIEKNDGEPRVMGDFIEDGDEINRLMKAYNDMAVRINSLIDKEYKERLKRQDINLARQRAELHALHSQINPHFLFNALESIRMHSYLKKENETAGMIEKLAVIARQNVEWGDDCVYVSDEVKFVEAYLELQKYRFGNKLMYEISVDEDCKRIRLPKISLVTFVENACVHGMENKTSKCWIFVRIYREYNCLILEVEDTGNGIPEEDCRKLLEDLEVVDMSAIEGRKSVGILNAALRLKMYTHGEVKFEIESERGVGTMITIRIPDCSADNETA